MSDPGRLSQRLMLEVATETPDGAGGVTRGYAAGVPIWAEVTPLNAREATLAAAAGVSVTHRIVVRGGVTITTRDRLRHVTRIFRILNVREQDALGRFLLIEAEERRD
jgi:SPP1 family predicted phage head-tail adaptor